MLGLGLDPTDPSTDPTTPVGIGNTACAAVLDFRHGDGSNQLGDINGGAPYSDCSDYVPVNSVDTIVDPNHWQPLTYSNGLTPPYLAPHWGLVVPFALHSGSALRPVRPRPTRLGCHGCAAASTFVMATLKAASSGERSAGVSGREPLPSSAGRPSHSAVRGAVT